MPTADPGDPESLSFCTGIRLLATFAREDRSRYALTAALAVDGTICQLGPFWVIYRALSDEVAGSAIRDGLFGLAALALAFAIAQHAADHLPRYEPRGQHGRVRAQRPRPSGAVEPYLDHAHDLRHHRRRPRSLDELAAMRPPIPGAIPQVSEAAVKTRTPVRNIRLRP